MDDERLGDFGGSGAGSASGSVLAVDASTGSFTSGMTVASGATASAGTVTMAGSGSTAMACSESACGELCVLCGDECVDEQIDTSNCGGCALVCPAGTVCSRGACVCRPGWVACSGPGGVLDLCAPDTFGCR